MGVAPSKKKKSSSVHDIRTEELERAPSPVYESPDDIRILTISKQDEEVLRVLKKDLNETPEIFVLNNVLMSVMFFENYHKDSAQISRKVLEHEDNVIKPDLVLNRISKNIRYRPIHGVKKQFSETIAPKRIYQINSDIEVDQSIDDPQDETIPVFRLKTEESSRKGYLKLREVTSEPIRYKVNISHTPVLKELEPTPSTSRSSTDNDSDTNYAYTTITNLKTPKPIEIVQGLQNANPEIKSCCVYRMIKRTDILDDDRDISEITEDDLFETVSYLNTRRYMKLFANNLFPNCVAQSLGFDETDIASAETIPGKLFCSLMEKEHAYIPHEILPSIRIAWPEFQTFLWQGSLTTDGASWPNSRMIDKMRNFDCTLVPKGYFKKRGEYRGGDLEWEIHFPRAESYLESCMSHAQIKCFLTLLTLHKYYIEDATRQQGLLTEHIRTHMFWECAENFKSWPEHRLGIKLITILSNLSNRIRKGKLNHFFVRDKNLFQDIPRKYLEHANKTLHDILQAPLMHFIKALRNIRYTSGKYYPPLDFKELFHILTIPSTGSKKDQTPLIVTPKFKKRRYDDKETQLEHLKELDTRKKIWEKKQKQLLEQNNSNLNGPEERRGSVDSINLEWNCEKRFDWYKKRLLLKFFIHTFLGIAKKSSKLGTNKQTLFYLKQCWYLSKILEDESVMREEEAEQMMEEINKEIAFCNSRLDADDEASDENGVTNDFSNNEEKVKLNVPSNGKPRKSVAFVTDR